MGQRFKTRTDSAAGTRGRNAQPAPDRAASEAVSPAPQSWRSHAPRLVALAAAAGLAAALGVAALRVSTLNRQAEAQISDAGAAIGGPFHLIDQDGRPVDQQLLNGRWSAVFFGYTNCPDTCPATLQALNAASGRLSPQARRTFQVVFVSVDPARDTPAQMKLYTAAQGFAPGRLIGLTGTPAQVAAVARAYHVYYAKAAPEAGGGYAVQHSAAVYLMNPRGRFVRPLSETTPPPELASQIAAAMTG